MGDKAGLVFGGDEGTPGICFFKSYTSSWITLTDNYIFAAMIVGDIFSSCSFSPYFSVSLEQKSFFISLKQKKKKVFISIID